MLSMTGTFYSTKTFKVFLFKISFYRDSEKLETWGLQNAILREFQRITDDITLTPRKVGDTL